MTCKELKHEIINVKDSIKLYFVDGVLFEIYIPEVEDSEKFFRYEWINRFN